MNHDGMRHIERRPTTVRLCSHIWTLLLLVATLATLARPAAAHAQSGPRLSVQPRIRTAVDAQSLQIPWSSWPAGAANETGQALSPNDADNPDKNFFAYSNFHRQLYRSHGMQGGYYQQARLTLARTKDTVDVYWLGSYYSNADQAAAGVADAVGSMRVQGVDGQSCFLDDQANCHLYIFPNLIYAVWSDQTTVGELLLLSPLTFFGPIYALASDQKATGTDLKQLLAAADTTVIAAAGGGVLMTEAPAAPQPTIKIDNITLYHDVKGKILPTTVVNVGDILIFTAAFHVSNFGTYSPSGGLEVYVPYGNMQWIQDVKPTATKPATTKVVFDGPLDFGQDSNGAPVLLSLGTIDSAAVLGKVVAHLTGTLSSASDTQTMQFTVKERPAPCKAGYKAKAGKCVKAKK